MAMLASFIYSKILSRKSYWFSPWPLRLYKETLFAVHPTQRNSKTSNSSSGCKSLICVVSKPEGARRSGALFCRQKRNTSTLHPSATTKPYAVRPRLEYHSVLHNNSECGARPAHAGSEDHTLWTWSSKLHQCILIRTTKNMGMGRLQAKTCGTWLNKNLLKPCRAIVFKIMDNVFTHSLNWRLGDFEHLYHANLVVKWDFCWRVHQPRAIVPQDPPWNPTPQDPPERQHQLKSQCFLQSQILMMAFWLQRIVHARDCGRAMPFGEKGVFFLFFSFWMSISDCPDKSPSLMPQTSKSLGNFLNSICFHDYSMTLDE